MCPVVVDRYDKLTAIYQQTFYDPRGWQDDVPRVYEDKFRPPELSETELAERRRSELAQTIESVELPRDQLLELVANEQMLTDLYQSILPNVAKVRYRFC